MQKPLILLIERDWRMSKFIRANLETSEMQVVQAVGGQHGLELLREYKPDLILVDLDLLDMDASHLLGVLRGPQARTQLPLILISAERPGRRLTGDLQAVHYLRKPFAASVLLHQVQQALA